MFQVRQADDILPRSLSTWTTEQRWKAWAHAEEQVRVATGLYIHDTELSTLLIARPVLKHSASNIPVTSSDRFWKARNAAEWNALNEERKANTPPTSQLTEVSEFTQFTMLEAFLASISDSRSLHTGLRDDTRKQFERWLSQFYDDYLKRSALSQSSPFCLEILWHSAFLALFVDFDRLELATGREGYAQSLAHHEYIQRWACSQDGRRCALHGALVLRKAQEMTLGVEPAIHVPRVLYQAAMIWFAYLKFGVDNHDSPKDFPELAHLNVNCQALLFESNGFKISRPKLKESSTLSGLVDLLRRIGHWGISRKFADQLVRMMQGNTEDEQTSALL
ncbi:hypothetical protein N7448_004658 [Penicillium atrosanguineum]|uniref:uncharacterized protein n=1 Tax=Penicillium atrosanguineum TaxID=1132637 RepID=UPI002391F7C2|nr:uncharacterized protein N7443_008409 [Penicillium atrosanguineum]KAJ5125337.1 hypothetical protein N7526_007514 [Penicillium atrosanguineum]KAJ5136104.1 hypothetical protein N7448_004658 [Penicillium atrosanguineum]KAJ5292456.1 hypothetical protein N7443_008409 [Penicillium atrosanguineum]